MSVCFDVEKFRRMVCNVKPPVGADAHIRPFVVRSAADGVPKTSKGTMRTSSPAAAHIISHFDSIRPLRRRGKEQYSNSRCGSAVHLSWLFHSHSGTYEYYMSVQKVSPSRWCAHARVCSRPYISLKHR